jgi:hypothetical protein
MDIPVIGIALIAGILLPRNRALAVAVLGWCAGVAMVAWGPAHNDNVHLDSIGFWGPWAAVLAICCALVLAANAIRRHRRAPSGLGGDAQET